MFDSVKTIVRTLAKRFFSIPNLWNKSPIHIVTDGHDWVIGEVSKSLSTALSQRTFARVSISPFFYFLSGKIIHFNSIPVPQRFPKNKVIMTWYHIPEHDPRLSTLRELEARVDLIHTSTHSTKQTLVQHGFPPEKILVIPQGINLTLFTPASKDQKREIRTALGIPEKAFVIGSFQKDGDGWGEGMNPKLIKGPDVFCDVIEQLAKKIPVHVLLSGPSRGYVKDRLTRANIPFTHQYPKAYKDVNKLYHALDVYLISSRIEGVPMALLESWATGIPLVSTRVGMVQDVAEHETNALLADVEDRERLVQHLETLFHDHHVRDHLAHNGLESVKAYDWSVLIDRYWKELYQPLLRKPSVKH